MSKPVARPGAWPGRTATSVDEVFALVRARGGRATSSRRAILEVLFEAGEHLTAESIARAVQERAPEVHMSTIYRNLEDMQRLGVLVHSHLGHGPATYQLASAAHAHFLCEVCESTFEAPVDVFSGLAKSVKARIGFSIDPVHFAMLGRCAACQAAAPLVSR
ncbi:MAG TPA: transcriptional repressor [Acidimicrobiales bacterium]|nr:transcriptional repressor [Acidimicrobiales bacterium]